MTMTEDLLKAKKILQADLDNARKGVTYWTQYAKSLEEALSKLDHIDDNTGSPKVKPSKAEKVAKPKLSDKEKLPNTGGDFWKDQFGPTPLGTAELLANAAKSLGLKNLSKDSKKRLASRLATATQLLIKADQVKAHGAGRQRTYTSVNA